MKLWYKKTKIALYDMSLSKQEGPKGTHEKVPIGKIIAVPTDTSDVDSEEEATKEHE
jgi:hypothetical protein